MGRGIESSMDATKQRERAEISSQVQEFLRRGGRIEVIESEVQPQRAMLLKGSAGHDIDLDLPGAG